MTDMTRAEAIALLKALKNNLHETGKDFPYRDEIIPLSKEALDMAIASLTIDEKYDLEFARSEKDIDLVGYRKTMMDSFDKRR